MQNERKAQSARILETEAPTSVQPDYAHTVVEEKVRESHTKNVHAMRVSVRDCAECPTPRKHIRRRRRLVATPPYIITNPAPAATVVKTTRKRLAWCARAPAMWLSSGPKMPPLPVAPGLGAPPDRFPPPSMLEGAVVAGAVEVVEDALLPPLEPPAVDWAIVLVESCVEVSVWRERSEPSATVVKMDVMTVMEGVAAAVLFPEAEVDPLAPLVDPPALVLPPLVLAALDDVCAWVEGLDWKGGRQSGVKESRT